MCALIIILISHTFCGAQRSALEQMAGGGGAGLLWAGATLGSNAADAALVLGLEARALRDSGHLLGSPPKQMSVQRKHS